MPINLDSEPLVTQQTEQHQTKCSEFQRKPRVGAVLQPELDYLAPEIWRQAKCSHKSDLFSFGLVLVQTYDLSRHRPPINCQFEAANYEPEVKKVSKRPA